MSEKPISQMLNEFVDQVAADQERERCRRLTLAVTSGWEAFVGAGRALVEIRDRCLFKAKYPTFSEYVEREFGVTEDLASRMISAANATNVKVDVGRALLEIAGARDDADVRAIRLAIVRAGAVDAFVGLLYRRLSRRGQTTAELSFEMATCSKSTLAAVALEALGRAKP